VHPVLQIKHKRDGQIIWEAPYM